MLAISWQVQGFWLDFPGPTNQKLRLLIPFDPLHTPSHQAFAQKIDQEHIFFSFLGSGRNPKKTGLAEVFLFIFFFHFETESDNSPVQAGFCSAL